MSRYLLKLCVRAAKALVGLCGFSLNVFIANTKQGVGPQVFSTLVTALPLQYIYKALHRQWRTYLSRDMRFPTKRSVRPAKAQTSLHIRAV